MARTFLAHVEFLPANVIMTPDLDALRFMTLECKTLETILGMTVMFSSKVTSDSEEISEGVRAE